MKNTMKNFTPTKDQIRAAEAVFTAMAFEATVRPIVETYELAILEKHQFRISRKWVEKGITDRLVLERKDTFLLDDEDAKVYYAECFAARDAAKLAVDDPEHCPLLVAEHLRIKAENALLQAISAIPGLETFASGVMTMEIRKKVVDLSLGMLSPFCGNADDILGRIVSKAA